MVRRVALEHLDWLETPQRRHELIVEMLRQTGLWNFQFFHDSTAWRSYLALHATFLSLPAGELRDDVQAALTRSERAVTDQIAAAYEHVAGLLGYWLQPELGATFETMAGLLNATMRGMVLMAPTIPDIVTRRSESKLFGTAAPAEWSQPALVIATITLGFLEPGLTMER